MGPTIVGNLLPNLKISVADTEHITQPSEIEPVNNDSKVEIVRPNLDKFTNQKVYMNKYGGFTTGIDLINEEDSGILKKRATRFGLSCTEPKQSIKSLYESMGINFKTQDNAKLKQIRLDTIHMRGVDEFDTDAVFAYFKDYGPLGVEWINDSSCNVVMSDDGSCARALLGRSIPLPDDLNPNRCRSSKKSDLSEEDACELPESEMDSSTTKGSINIPVPPGEWRLGIEEKNGKKILLRFATKDDKKIKGAEKRSKYYQKFGNPNYGGIKGYITSTKKRKIQTAANRWTIGSQSSKSVSTESAPKTKSLRMRMYADDEELNKKTARSKDYGGRSVKSRLGKKYTSDELCQLGTYHNFDSEDEHYIKEKSVKSDDLRSKLQTIRNNDQATSAFKRKYESYKMFDDRESKRRSYNKRKYRSPLCMDDEEEDDDDDEP